MNQGTIAVLEASGGGRRHSLEENAPTIPPHSGRSLQAAMNGSLANSGDVLGGLAGQSLSLQQAASILNPGLHGGGGGGAGYAAGGSGGGTITVVCRGEVVNSETGVFSVNGGPGGSPGGGGGAGGIVVIASNLQVTNLGIIEANGGNGGAAASQSAGGAGGGGGIIHLIAPTVEQTGSCSVLGGSSPSSISAIAGVRTGGGGGGACGGSGGVGGNVVSDQGLAGSSSASGRVISSEVDPTALF